jgi:hypothetical protein
MFEFAQAKFHVGRAGLGGVLAGLLQHLVRHVDADDATGGAHLPRGKKAIEAGAAAEIDDHLAGLERRDRLRVAAAEAEIGAVGDRGEFGVGIAHLARLLGRVAEHGVATARARRAAAFAAARHVGNRAVAGAHHCLDLLVVLRHLRRSGIGQRVQQAVAAAAEAGRLIDSGVQHVGAPRSAASVASRSFASEPSP